MIYLLTYLAIGVGLSVYASFYLPAAHERTRYRASQIPHEKIAAMSPRERAVLQAAINTTNAKLSAVAFVVIGLLWPLQVLAVVASNIWTWHINRRAQKIYGVKLDAPCPGCGQNLCVMQGTDCTEANDTSGIVAFVCGQCSTGSRWRLAARDGLERFDLLGVVPVAHLKDH